MVRAVYLTNIPVPYRDPVHQSVTALLDGSYHVAFAHEHAPYSQTTGLAYPHSFLNPGAFEVGGRFVYANRDVWRRLDELDPDVLITTGFSPTFLAGVAWCRWRNRPHVPFQDGWLGSEASLGPLHRLARRWVIRSSSTFLVPSLKSRAFFLHYGVPDGRIFTSHLCADNDAFTPWVGAPPTYDLMFSGRLEPMKQPMLFARVATRLARRRPSLKVLVLGKGVQRAEVEEQLRRGRVTYTYAGFAPQRDLPRHYSSARVFMFPTTGEPWGVVANEACAAGVPVVTTPGAGAAGEIVVHGKTGLVLPLDEDLWVEQVGQLLDDEDRRSALGRAAREIIAPYNYEAAAQGIVDAVRAASRN